MKMENISCATTHTKRMKIQVTDWEKTFANDFADKGPISTLDKEFSKLSSTRNQGKSNKKGKRQRREVKRKYIEYQSL